MNRSIHEAKRDATSFGRPATPAFLDDEGPSTDLPQFITTVTARELFDLRPGEDVAHAAARKAAEV